MSEDTFAERIVSWQRLHGRHDLPWQHKPDPYPVWLSEIMLQQTQVSTVLPYFQAFLAAFPDVQSLAAAPAESVMRVWSGLGYYSRARNLHRCAQQVVDSFGGRFPGEREQLERLPGIGRSTAAAIAVFAFGRREAILDGNVKRVLCRHDAIEGVPDASATQKVLWARAEAKLPATDLRAYTQGLMDLGATVCTRGRPDCGRCPVASTCVALAQGRQNDLPTRRQRKVLPLRRTDGLILLADTPGGALVFLPKREAKGIWGGLRSLPDTGFELVDGGLHGVEDVSAGAGRIKAAMHELFEVGEVGSVVATAAQPLAVVEHTFTHFRLRLQPWLIHVTLPAGEGCPPKITADWFRLDEAAATAPVPAPISRLLQALAADGDMSGGWSGNIGG